MHPGPSDRTIPAAQAGSNGFWLNEALHSGLPTFPIRIFWDAAARKWRKVPLTKGGHLDASYPPPPFPANANGYGIPLGAGLYALDVDTYKGAGPNPAKAWIVGRSLRDVPTRVHRTVSGGWHLIFRLPPDYADLPSRSDVVPGLDTRGAGGWIAFGQGYELYDDSEPALLPEAVCAELLAGHSSKNLGTTLLGPLVWNPPADPEKVKRKWAVARYRQNLLLQRVHGVKTSGDMSRSGLDHSVAHLLAQQGWEADEIAFVLLELFEHGACREGPDRVRLRAALRCAAKAILARETAAEALRGTGLNGPDEKDFERDMGW